MTAAYRAAALITANVAAHTVDGCTAQHMVVAAHERTIRMLCDELNVLHGHGQTPQRGTQHAWLLLAEAEVLVEYEVEPEEGDGWHEPHHPEQINILGVFINGHWLDASECIPEPVLDRWRDQLGEVQADLRHQAEDDRAEARARDRSEYAA